LNKSNDLEKKDMKIKKYSLKFVFSALAILSCVFVSTSTVNAQTSRRKKTTRPIVSQTPLPDGRIPVVISRMEDIPSENQIIQPEEQPQQPAPTETLEDKIDKFNTRMKEMNSRLKTLESTQKNEYDEKQKRLLLNLDILTRAEQRAETLRKQLFDMVEKENSIKKQLEDINYNLQPEMIERSASVSGSLRPEEVRDERKKSLEAEKANLDALLTQIQTNRLNLEENVQKADSMVEKIRARTEKDIDDALTDDNSDPQ